ncbi:MAG: PQQ-binding-like beta-propeller repeat protein, partial [Rhizomicrobium sp.]
MEPFSGKATLRTFVTAAAMSVIACQAHAAKGDWPMMNYDAQGTRNNRHETILNTKTVKSLQLAWQVNGLGSGPYSPAVVDGVVYVSGFPLFYALDAITGKTIWTVANEYGTAPAVANGIVYIARSDGHLDAFDAASGTAIWSMGLDSGVSLTSPTVFGGRVFIQDNQGFAYAFNARTGNRLWKSDAKLYSSVFESAPVVAKGAVYFTSASGIHAYDARTGAEIWEDENSGWNPWLVAGKHYVYSTAASVQANDMATGQKMWVGKIPSGGLALAKNDLFDQYDTAYFISRFDSGSGQLTETETNPYSVMEYAPTIVNGVLYSFGSCGICAFDAKTAKLLWSSSLGKRQPPSSTEPPGPVVANGMLYFRGTDSLIAYALKN